MEQSTKILAKYRTEDPGRVRQNSSARAGRNLSQPRTNLYLPLCILLITNSLRTFTQSTTTTHLREFGGPWVLHRLPDPGPRLADPTVAEVLVLLPLRLLLLMPQVALQKTCFVEFSLEMTNERAERAPSSLSSLLHHEGLIQLIDRAAREGQEGTTLPT